MTLEVGAVPDVAEAALPYTVPFVGGHVARDHPAVGLDGHVEPGVVAGDGEETVRLVAAHVLFDHLVHGARLLDELLLEVALDGGEVRVDPPLPGQPDRLLQVRGEFAAVLFGELDRFPHRGVDDQGLHEHVGHVEGAGQPDEIRKPPEVRPREYRVHVEHRRLGPALAPEAAECADRANGLVEGARDLAQVVVSGRVRAVHAEVDPVPAHLHDLLDPPGAQVRAVGGEDPVHAVLLDALEHREGDLRQIGRVAAAGHVPLAHAQGRGLVRDGEPPLHRHLDGAGEFVDVGVLLVGPTRAAQTAQVAAPVDLDVDLEGPPGLPPGPVQEPRGLFPLQLIHQGLS